MKSISLAVIAAILSFTSAAPTGTEAAKAKRTVTALDQVAFAKAHTRDDTATRAMTGGQILTTDGKCLSVSLLSGDFRANLNPIDIKPCDGSDGEKWDLITKGKHNDQANSALLVNGLTGACLNFDDRRKPGNQVIMFSCGGRADGDGLTTRAQTFKFNGVLGGTTALTPLIKDTKCMQVDAANSVLDIADCNGAAPQVFAFEPAGGAGAPPAASAVAPPTASNTAAPAVSAAPPAASAAIPPAAAAPPAAGKETVTVTVTAKAAACTTAKEAAKGTASAAKGVAQGTGKAHGTGKAAKGTGNASVEGQAKATRTVHHMTLKAPTTTARAY